MQSEPPLISENMGPIIKQYQTTVEVNMKREQALLTIDAALESFEKGTWTFRDLTKAILNTLKYLVEKDVVRYCEGAKDMGMEFIDKSGEPRSDEELEEAIDCVKTIMVKHPLALPLFTVHALLIVDCLRELQLLRKLIREAKAIREAKVKDV